MLQTSEIMHREKIGWYKYSIVFCYKTMMGNACMVHYFFVTSLR